ncbi:MAG TPA: hypothetical protein VHO25_22025 [Polyangiaceae bacterium]|nr:hypothetical protein [Polyangiaceae bacterium]
MVDFGCQQQSKEIFPGSPSIKYLLNPQNGKTVTIEHWVMDEEVSPITCSNVCRLLGIDEKAVKLTATDGDGVTVSSPPEPMQN